MPVSICVLIIQEMIILEFAVIFLEGVPPKEIKFKKLGAMHRARFVACLIYRKKIVN